MIFPLADLPDASSSGDREGFTSNTEQATEDKIDAI